MRKKNLINLAAISITLLVFLLFTNPNQVSLPLILVPFVLFGILVFLAIKIVLGLFLNSSINGGKITLVALICSVILVNFALLRSIGQLTFQDGIISLLITVIAIIYITKFQFKQ